MPRVTALQLHRKSRILDVTFEDGARHALSCEYLRVFSPSAEVRGHSGGEPALIGGKRNVNIERIEPIGQYAVRLCFDDGHATGLYSWDVLAELAAKHEDYWTHYLRRLEKHGMSRDSDVAKLSALQPGKWKPPG